MRPPYFVVVDDFGEKGGLARARAAQEGDLELEARQDCLVVESLLGVHRGDGSRGPLIAEDLFHGDLGGLGHDALAELNNAINFFRVLEAPSLDLNRVT